MSRNGADMSAERQKAIEDFGRRRFIAEEGMRRGVAMAHTGGAVFARFAHSYIEDRLWEGEYASLGEALQQPGIGVSEKHARNLALVFRKLVIERKVPFEELEGVDLRTVQIGLPALSDPKHPRTWQEVVDDAKTYPREEMRRKYGDARGPDGKLDATREPERQPCPLCGTYVEKDRIPEGEREAA